MKYACMLSHLKKLNLFTFFVNLLQDETPDIYKLNKK